jgi:uncharacterized membrane protein
LTGVGRIREYPPTLDPALEAEVTWYEFLLFVHVAGAIIWIGGAFVFQVSGLIELRSGDSAAIARFAGNAGRIGERLFVPTSLVVVLAGVGLMIEGSWPWGRLWVVFALVAFAGSFVLGAGVLGPTAKRIEVVGAETQEGQRSSDASSRSCESTSSFSLRSCSR